MSQTNPEGENKEIASQSHRLLTSNDAQDDMDLTISNPDINGQKEEMPPDVSSVESDNASSKQATVNTEGDNVSGIQSRDNGIDPPPVDEPEPQIVENENNTTLPPEILPALRIRPAPDIDEYGMPLPRRSEIKVPRLDPSGGIGSIKPASFASNQVPLNNALGRNKSSPGSKRSKPIKKKNRKSSLTPKQGIGCILRMFVLAILAAIVVVVLGGSFMVYEYYNIAATLPSVADLQKKASNFETTRIFDRNGDLLYEILDPAAGRRTFVTLDKISGYMVAATVATEDKSFFNNPGFDWTAIVRAFWQNFQKGETVSGASTITQQLARSLVLAPEERTEQSYMRKVREALLAAEITHRYSKEQILELYLNEFYFGNHAYGIEAASETYFNTTADKLDLAQASFLAGLLQAPSAYDVYQNREGARQRQKQVLTLMYEASTEEGCIFVSENKPKVCVNANDAVAAYVQLESYNFNPPDVQIKYPHWVNYINDLLESQFDTQTIYRSGFSVYTTIDPGLQDEAEKLVKQQVDSLADYDAKDGALIAIRPATGEILAMVGSADFYNDNIDGQVNMAISATRQPGSSIKPITYIAAFEKGWTPATLIWDVPSEFPPSGDPTDPRPPYVPVNYDGRFHGPVTVRSALANSYNIPAVKTLQFVGIYDDPSTPNEDGMIAVAKKMGITSLTRPDYGLSLTLGGGEVSLLEMTGAFAVIANNGLRMPTVAITKILDHNGDVVFENQTPPGDQVVRPEHAFLITSILSDNEARAPMFGANSVLALPFSAAAKTGTSNDYRDNWTLGYTPDIAVGVWVGNADYSPMKNISGVTGAAPIWAEFMQSAIQQLMGGTPTPFNRPSGIVDRVICSASGTEPSQWCTNQRSEIFAADQLPLPSSQDLWTKVVFDTWTGLRASDVCPDYKKEEFALNVTDPWAIGWIQNNSEGQQWAHDMGFTDPIKFAPARDCLPSDPHPIIEISSPQEGQTVTVSPLDFNGRIDVAMDFQEFTIEYGIGDNPVEWRLITQSNQPISQPAKIYSWDLKDIQVGVITLKLTMHSIRGGYAEKKIHINLQVPTPSPTLTPSSTPSLTPSLTPTITVTPTTEQTLIPKPTITQTPGVTDTPGIVGGLVGPITATPTPTPLP